MELHPSRRVRTSRDAADCRSRRSTRSSMLAAPLGRPAAAPRRCAACCGRAPARSAGAAPDDAPAAARCAALRRCSSLVAARRRASARRRWPRCCPTTARQPLERGAPGPVRASCSRWVSAGFWTALMGVGVLLVGRGASPLMRGLADAPVRAARPGRAHRDRHADLQRARGARVRRPARDLRVARAHRRSSQHFDFFVLRDTQRSRHCASPSTPPGSDAVPRRSAASARVFYRWRQHRIKRKSGNVADFCRRWGADYRYMVVLDADSVMTGECLTTLVRLMEAHPDAGIIQTAPRAVGRETLLRARAAVRGARLRAAVHRRAALLAARRIALLGPQRDHPRRAVHARTARSAPLPGRGRAVGRDPVARLRRGRADAPRRLGGVDRLRPRRQLRADAAEPARRAAARPPLVPGQPAELAPDVRAAACTRRIARCS